jgi:hypothetical protein
MSLAYAHYDSWHSLTEVGGKPAVIYLSSPAANIYEITYAYCNVPEPDSAADWTFTPATFTSAPSERYLPSWLVAHDGLPAYTFWSSQSEQLCFAQASTATPTGTGDWLISPVDMPYATSFYNALVEYQGQPLVIYRGPGSGMDNLHCAHSPNWNPTSVLDWEQHTVDSESNVESRMSIAQMPDGIGVAYHDIATGSLMYAWINDSLPHGGGDWCVMQVAGGITTFGVNAVAAMANGLPAIVYGDPANSKLHLATMNQPE